MALIALESIVCGLRAVLFHNKISDLGYILFDLNLENASNT